MGSKMKAIAVALFALAALVLFSGCTSTDFKSGYKTLKGIDGKYLLEGEIITDTKEKLDAYEKDLKGLEADLKGQAKNDDISALLLLVDTRLDLVEMQNNYSQAAAELKKIDISAIDCGEGGSLKTSAKYFGEAAKKSEVALTKVQLFLKNYASKASSVSFDSENYESTLTVIKDRYNEIRTGILASC